MIIIDESYKKLDEVYRGRKPKYGLIKNNNKYIFKYGALNNEIFAELIAEQIGLQMGIDMAHYEIATHNGIVGVITNNFIGTNQFIISSDHLREHVKDLYKENNIYFDEHDNSITNIVSAAWAYDSTIKTDELIIELIKRWTFYGVILENDKNDTNISFLKDINGLKLSPDYDNSSMCQLNKNISLLLNDLKRGKSISLITDFIQNKLHLSKNSLDFQFLKEFEIGLKKYPLIMENIVDLINNINIDEAIQMVEKINNISIPYDIQFWIRKAIDTRIQDINIIYNKINCSKGKELHKKM